MSLWPGRIGRKPPRNGDNGQAALAGHTQLAGPDGRERALGVPPGSNGHPNGVHPGQASPLPLTQPAIDLLGVTKLYDTPAGPFPALKGIDLRVYPGEFLAVVGRSGSGKSTLINVFTGIDHPTGGEVLVAGTRLRDLDEGQMAEWRGRHLGIIFQFFQLLPALTLLENVLLPMDLCQVYDPGERPQRALRLLEQVGITADADRFPSAVSGGQQQRAAIARALANDPPILVADEPTGNLDSATADTVFSLFASLASAGKTVVMVTHDDELAARVPRVLTLADGEIVEEVVRAPSVFLNSTTI